MNRVKAVVFDADGTLLDSFELIYSAYVYVANTHNLRVPGPEEIRSKMGEPLSEIFRSLYPNEDIAGLLDSNNAYIYENMITSKEFEGVDELLSDLNNRGIKLAILTSGGPRIHTILQHHDWAKYFSSVVHHERVSNPKPNKEGFLLASKECGVHPEEAIMIGDTVIDIETGKNAGALSTIALTHGFGARKDLEYAKPGYLVDSLAEVRPIIYNFIQEDTALLA